MSTKYKLRKLLLCAALEMAAWMGAPMRPEEIERFLHSFGRVPVHGAAREGAGDPTAPDDDAQPHRPAPAEKGSR